MIPVLLLSLAAYLIAGAVFSIPFVRSGAGRMDPHARRGSWGFRLMIIPGTIFLWPLLARRWLGGAHEPPEERTAHRDAARSSP